MKKTICKLITILFINSIISAASAQDNLANTQPNKSSSVLWGDLKQGKYDVGYQSEIIFDYSRSYKYNPNSREKQFRPVLFNVWYPAEGSSSNEVMTYGSYMKVRSVDSNLADFCDRLTSFNYAAATNYALDTGDDPTGMEDEILDSLFKSKGIGQKNAQKETGKFPLIIYHMGLGASMEDNLVMCEYLASHGFIVVNSAYQSDNPKALGVDWDLSVSIPEIRFLLNQSLQLENVNPDKIVLMGQSYGAQAVLGFGSKNSSVVDAILSFDSTIDYAKENELKNFGPLANMLRSGSSNMDYPLLITAQKNRKADFIVCNDLNYSDRTFVNFTGLKHNDFTSQGALGKYFIYEMTKSKKINYLKAWKQYQLLCEFSLDWIRNALANSTQLSNSFKSRFNQEKITFSKKHQSKISFNQFLEEYDSKGIAEAIKLYNSYALHLDKGEKMFKEHILNELGYGLLEDNKVDDAIQVFILNVSSYPDSSNPYDSLGEAYMIKGDKENSILNYQKSYDLDNSNSNAKKIINELKQTH